MTQNHPNEAPPKTLSESLDDWKKMIHGEEQQHPTPHTFDVVHEVWVPKVKWFRPPRWNIFRWAYHIKRAIYRNCYPAAMRTTVDEDDETIHIRQTTTMGISPEVAIQFTCQPYHHPSIDKRAEEILKEFNPSINEPDDNSHTF